MGSNVGNTNINYLAAYVLELFFEKLNSGFHERPYESKADSQAIVNQ